MSRQEITRTVDNENKFQRIVDQLEFLREECDNEQAFSRAENKLEASIAIMDKEEASEKLDEAKAILDSLERFEQYSRD